MSERNFTNDEIIERIARDKLGIDTLDIQNNDRLDFHDLAIWKIREALEAALLAGRNS